jgi:hypothetical protein
MAVSSTNHLPQDKNWACCVLPFNLQSIALNTGLTCFIGNVK